MLKFFLVLCLSALAFVTSAVTSSAQVPDSCAGKPLKEAVRCLERKIKEVAVPVPQPAPPREFKACAFAFSQTATATYTVLPSGERQSFLTGMVVPVPQSWKMRDCLDLAKRLAAPGSGPAGGLSIVALRPVCIFATPRDGHYGSIGETREDFAFSWWSLTRPFSEPAYAQMKPSPNCGWNE